MCHDTKYTLASTDPPPPELVKRGHNSLPFYSDLRVMVPLIIATVALLGAGAAAGLCWKHSKSLGSLQKVASFIWRHVSPLVEFIDVSTLIAEQPRPLKETLDNQQNAETQRERYYATIHKVALQAGGDKIPGNSGLAAYVWTNWISLWALDGECISGCLTA